MANLIRWRPKDLFTTFEGLYDFRDEMDRLIKGLSGWGQLESGEEGMSWFPAIDLEDETDKYVVKAELPGMKQQDIKVTVNDGTLVLSGEKKEEHKEKKGSYFRHERSFGKFQRAFTLPSHIQSDKIKAHYKDGILEIDIPKSEEVKPKQVEVKVS
jgi:HSP20 family protein